MSDVDPTPETPVTVGDRLGWLRGDVSGRLQSLVTAVGAVVGEVPKSIADVYQLLYSGVMDTSGVLHTPQLTVLRSQVADLQSRMDSIQSVLGAEPYSSTETGNIRAVLMQIMYGQAQATYGIPPVSASGDVHNDGTVAVEGRRYALFTPPINGVVVSENHREVTAQGSWLGWRAYVQTTAPVVYVNGDTDSPGAWLELTGEGSYSFAVDAQYPIAVTLRPPNGGLSWVFDGTQMVEGAYRAVFYPVSGYIELYRPLELIYLSTDVTGWAAENISGTGTVSVIRGEYQSAQNQYTVDIPPGGRVILEDLGGPIMWTWGTGPFWLRLTAPSV